MGHRLRAELLDQLGLLRVGAEGQSKHGQGNSRSGCGGQARPQPLWAGMPLPSWGQKSWAGGMM